MKSHFCLVLICCLFCVSCQNILTVRAGFDYFTPELQDKILATGRKLEPVADESFDREARKAFDLNRVRFRAGKDWCDLYYHKKTNQIVTFAEAEFELSSHESSEPLVSASVQFTDKARFPLYEPDPAIEAYLQSHPNHAAQYGLESFPHRWPGIFISDACKKFHDAEMKRTGKSVYEACFSHASAL